MKIRIKENQYKTLTEAVGVPTNIVDIARQVYENMMSILHPNIDIQDFLTNEIELNGSFVINNTTFNRIILDFKLQDLDDYDLNDNDIKLIVLGMTQRGTREMAKNFNYISTTNPTTINLFINLAVNSQTTTQDLIDTFRKDRVTIVSSLAHEIKHAYDDVMNPNINTSKRVDYETGSNRSSGGIEPLNKFIHYMYFSHITENLVRPTEIYSSFEELGITKQEFYNFILNNKTYQTYKDASQLTYEKLREQLLDDISEIKSTFDANNIQYPENGSDEEIVDFTLKEFYETMINWKGGLMHQLLTDNFIETLLGFEGNKKKYFIKYINKLNRFGEDYERFFRYELKQINYISSKMLKKISKIYSLLQDKNPQQ